MSKIIGDKTSYNLLFFQKLWRHFVLTSATPKVTCRRQAVVWDLTSTNTFWRRCASPGSRWPCPQRMSTPYYFQTVWVRISILNFSYFSDSPNFKFCYLNFWLANLTGRNFTKRENCENKIGESQARIDIPYVFIFIIVFCPLTFLFIFCSPSFLGLLVIMALVTLLYRETIVNWRITCYSWCCTVVVVEQWTYLISIQHHLHPE